MKKSEFSQIIKEILTEVLNEATTEFEFNPTIYAKGNIKVKEGDDYLNGKVVGKNYTFFNTEVSPNPTLKVSRWKEGKEPNNYTVYFSVPSEFAESYKPLSLKLKSSGKIVSSNNTSSEQYSRFNLSKNELMSLLELFASITPNS
jgi:hypothetical protein